MSPATLCIVVQISANTVFWVGQYSAPIVGQFSMPIYSKYPPAKPGALPFLLASMAWRFLRSTVLAT